MREREREREGENGNISKLSNKCSYKSIYNLILKILILADS
jgi:hypothetical protein